MIFTIVWIPCHFQFLWSWCFPIVFDDVHHCTYEFNFALICFKDDVYGFLLRTFTIDVSQLLLIMMFIIVWIPCSFEFSPMLKFFSNYEKNYHKIFSIDVSQLVLTMILATIVHMYVWIPFCFYFSQWLGVSKLLFTMIFNIVRIPFLIFFWWWWWWISFVNSHFVRSKTYCCCWHCIEVMEFETCTHTLGINSNCQCVLV